MAGEQRGKILIRRFLRFLIEDLYPIGFLSGIIIARLFWFPWWGYGAAVYVLALFTSPRLATPQNNRPNGDQDPTHSDID